MDKLEDLLESVNGWLRFAEAKNLALITISGAGLWAIIQLLVSREVNQLLVWYLAQFVILLAVALIAGLISFLPLTSYSILVPTGAASEKDNLAFFGHLAKYRRSQLLASFATAVDAAESDTQQFHEMLAEQIIVNSRIALAKYRMFEVGAYAFLLGLTTPILGLLVIAIARRQRRAIDGY
jgi:hypothetical protein